MACQLAIFYCRPLKFKIKVTNIFFIWHTSVVLFQSIPVITYFRNLVVHYYDTLKWRHGQVKRFLFQRIHDFVEQERTFSFLKINHGFWDMLEPIELYESWLNSFKEAKVLTKTLSISNIMMSDYVNELMHLLELYRIGLSDVEIFASVSAVPLQRIMRKKKGKMPF